MRKILILHFGCLNNYGTGMMGLVTVNELNKRYKGAVEFHCDFNDFSTIEDIENELSESVVLKKHVLKEVKPSRFKIFRVFQNLLAVFSFSETKKFDEIIILGGDDISEYYTNNIFLIILKYWFWSLFVPVTLLGQSIGPFYLKRNRWIVKYFMGRIKVIVRDGWTKGYLKKEFSLENNIIQGADLAFYDLPRQNETELEKQVLKDYKLEIKKYCTMVISGLQGNYYTSNKENYFKAYEGFIKHIWSKYDGQIEKICLLAHTFPPHGNEALLLEEFYKRFSKEEQAKLVLVTDKVLQNKARFILGNGLFTITGRMHAAISTFQMGTPAIALSYSAKYKGVIGINLKRDDLIIECNEAQMWGSGEIITEVNSKVDYVMENQNSLRNEIRLAVKSEKERVNWCLNSLVN